MLLDILLLEDDPAKKHRLLEFLNSKKGQIFGRVDTALSVNDTLARVKETRYDLLVADVIVPAVLGGQAHEDHAIDLFTQIDEGIGINRPRYSVAMSASSELGPKAKEFFIGRPWGILSYSDDSDECLITIEKICRYIIGRRSKGSPEQKCDIFILTALMEPEFSALEATSIEWSPFEPLDEMQFVKFGKVETSAGMRTVGAAFAPRMGPISAAILTAKVALKLRPKLLVHCGICAGIPGGSSIGDVIAADISWDWQSGKLLEGEEHEQFEGEPHQIAIDNQTRAQLILLKRDQGYWNSLKIQSESASQPLPKLIIGPMATGSAVLANGRAMERIKKTQHRKVAGLDMESYGVYLAALSCDSEISFLALKAVCDNGNKEKSDQFQMYAAQIAALTVLHFIKTHADPIMRN